MEQTAAQAFGPVTLVSEVMATARSVIAGAVLTVTDLIMLPVLVGASIAARFRGRELVGFGPEPLINNVYHAQALRRSGFNAESFAINPYFITNRFDVVLQSRSFLAQTFSLVLRLHFFFLVFRYSAVFMSFVGGPLRDGPWLWRVEPWLLKLAGVKVVILPYGGDVQDLRRCRNLEFVDAVAKDYPTFFRRSGRIGRQVDLWQRHASVIYSGCDWVDYMTYWDVLQVAHFSIDTDAIQPSPLPGVVDASRPLRVLHAPNHRAIKGTQRIVDAVEQLRQEGCNIELVLLERVPNERVHEMIQSCDVVADQLVIGWYAMFAMEGMAHGRAVVCRLEGRYLDLYRGHGLIAVDEPPLIDATTANVKEVLRRLAEDREEVASAANRGRAYVEKVHSLDVVGAQFAQTLAGLGIRAGRVSASDESTPRTS